MWTPEIRPFFLLFDAIFIFNGQIVLPLLAHLYQPYLDMPFN